MLFSKVGITTLLHFKSLKTTFGFYERTCHFMVGWLVGWFFFFLFIYFIFKKI